MLAIVSVVLGSPCAAAEAARYVNVTVEFHGLEDAAQTLKTALGTLAASVETLAKTSDQLDPDQLQQVERIAITGARQADYKCFGQVILVLGSIVQGGRRPGIRCPLMIQLCSRNFLTTSSMYFCLGEKSFPLIPSCI